MLVARVSGGVELDLPVHCGEYLVKVGPFLLLLGIVKQVLLLREISYF